MPRCEGLPNGPCPGKVNDRYVKNTQGDLFLCKSCAEVRFPTVSHGNKQDLSVQRRRESARSRTHTTASPAATSDRSVNPVTTDTRQADDRVNTTTVLTDQHRPTVASNSSSNHCPVCNEYATENILACDICKNQIHHLCTGPPNATIERLCDIIQYTGWVCNTCRFENRQQIAVLQSAVAQLSEKLSDVLVKVDQLEKKHIAADKDLNISDVTVEVYKSLADVNKRKCNIVVSGLPEAPQDTIHDTMEHDTDRKTFESICEEHFSIKPSLSKKGCRRLGKHIDGQRPRKLLVHLENEHAASMLLAEAKKLRQSSDVTIASSVYLNPDCSPAELKLAYEKRQQRRQAKQRSNQENIDGSTHTVHAARKPTVIANTTSGVMSSGDDLIPSIDRLHTASNSPFRA